MIVRLAITPRVADYLHAHYGWVKSDPKTRLKLPAWVARMTSYEWLQATAIDETTIESTRSGDTLAYLRYDSGLADDIMAAVVLRETAHRALTNHFGIDDQMPVLVERLLMLAIEYIDEMLETPVVERMAALA